MRWPNSLRGNKMIWIGGLVLVALAVGIFLFMRMNKKTPETTMPPTTMPPPVIVQTTMPPVVQTTMPPPVVVQTTMPPAPAPSQTPFSAAPVVVKTSRPVKTARPKPTPTPGVSKCSGWYGDGPIYSNWGAQNGQCASMCRRLRPGSVFTGDWKTTVEGKKSVCQCRWKC